MPRHIAVNLFGMNTVGHISHGLWAHPDNTRHRFDEVDLRVQHARLLEEGLFDAVFLRGSPVTGGGVVTEETLPRAGPREAASRAPALAATWTGAADGPLPDAEVLLRFRPVPARIAEGAVEREHSRELPVESPPSPPVSGPRTGRADDHRCGTVPVPASTGRAVRRTTTPVRPAHPSERNHP